MKRFVSLFSGHKKAILITIVFLGAGACFRWEAAEIDDASTGQRITSHHRPVFPWTPCGATGGGRLINFHVRHWLCYGLVRVEATGQTM
ncbi:MAG TPA: hypothetical protein VJA21_27970 [Verrucomicrobiae bacterium]